MSAERMGRMSFSQFCRFADCEAAAIANLKGEWYYPESDALLIGKYFHAGLESPEALRKLTEENANEILNRKGEKYAGFKQADLMIEKIRSDKFCQKFFDGAEHEIELRGEFAGTEWTCRLDLLNRSKQYFVDFKSIAEIRKAEWVSKRDATGELRNRKVSFIEARHYDWQMALYGEIIRQNFDGEDLLPVIIAASKQNPVDLEVIAFTESLHDQLEDIRERMPRVLDVKNGAEPRRCGCCDYCRMTKHVQRMTKYSDFRNEVL